MSITKLSVSTIKNGFPKYQNAYDTSAIFPKDVVDVFGDGSGVALWSFDNSADEKGGNYNGSASNVTYDSSSKKVGTHSAVFNGSSSTISVPSVRTSYPISISVWAQNSSGWVPGGGVQEIFNMSVFDNASVQRRLTIGIVTNAGWPTGPTVMYGNSNHWSFNSSSVFNNNSTEFFHLVYNIPGYNSAPTCYINGVSYSFTNNGGGHGGSPGWNIGSNSTSGEWWNGKLDQLRVFNKTLSQSEVNQLYSQVI